MALLHHLPGGGNLTTLHSAPPAKPPVHSSNHLVTPRVGRHQQPDTAGHWGEGPSLQTWRQPLFSWQTCGVELGSWHCVYWPLVAEMSVLAPVSDLDWTGLSEPPSLRAEAVRTWPGSEKPGEHVPRSFRPGTGSQHRAEPWALLMAPGCCGDEPFGGSGCEVGGPSVLGSRRQALGHPAQKASPVCRQLGPAAP